MLQYDLGPCCACQKQGPDVRNMLCLNQKGPIEGRGWGCLVCGLPADGAVVILCDHCLQTKAEILYVCNGYPYQGRIPLADLPGEPFNHDLAYHPESRIHQQEEP